MKRLGLFLLAVVMGIGAVGMTGCSDDDAKTTSATGTAGITGTYTLTYATDTAGVSHPPFPSVYTFTSDGLVTSVEQGGTAQGTYTFNDPELVLIFSFRTLRGVVSDGGNTLTFNLPEGIRRYTKS